MLKTFELAALALYCLCAALLFVIHAIRFVVALSIWVLFVAAVVVGTVSYALGEIGLL